MPVAREYLDDACLVPLRMTLMAICRTEARLLWNHVAGSVFQGRYIYCTSTGLDHQTYGGERGTVLATRSALNGSNRPVPRARTAAQKTVVRRAVAPAHARALRGNWIADSEHVLLLFEPGRYPVAYFPETDVSPHALERTEHTTQHPDLGLTSWYSVRAGEQHIAPRGAWQHTDLPAHASEIQARVAFAWRAMDAFYEEDERIVGHAADTYHRIDIRQASRNLVVRHRDRIIADTKRPVVLYKSGFAPRWYVPRADIDKSALIPVKLQTFCPYKGLCSYYSIDDARLAAWSYPDAYPEVRRISNLVSFEPDIVSVHLDGAPAPS